MDAARLVAMANEIAAFFAGAAAPGEAANAVADHLRRYWEPRMRAALLAHVDAGGEGLGALAREAALALRAGAGRP